MNPNYDTQIPEAIEVEKKLLSALMLKGGTATVEVETMLKPTDFYRQEHKVIYAAIMKLTGEGVPIDTLLVEEELKRSGELERVTRQYLYAIAPMEYTTLRATQYAEIIKEKSLLRQLMTLGRAIEQSASTERQDAGAVLEYAQREILGLTNQQMAEGFEAVGDILKRSFARIDELRKNPDAGGIKSGLYDLDRLLNGFQKSDLILLAARPSMGKTALALNMAVHASRNSKVALYSLEMSKVQLGNRLLSTASGVNGQNLNSGRLNDEELDALIDGLDRISECKLYIDDTAGMGLSEMRNKARRLKHEYGLDMVIIDYLQLMTGGKAENRQQEISEISRQLKAMARELDVPIIALSQLSRSVELRAEKKPQLSDLRESGSLEQDADIVMFLYRDEYYNRDDAENKNIAELIVAKNRNGPTTSIHLYFDKETMKFSDLTRAEH